MKNYYQILGVAPTAKIVAIRKAYRNMARKLHPDVNKSPEAHDQFIALTEAYEVLKNPITRAQYDRVFVTPQSKPKPTPPPQKQKTWETQVQKAAARGVTKGEKFVEDPTLKLKRNIAYFIHDCVAVVVAALVWALNVGR